MEEEYVSPVFDSDINKPLDIDYSHDTSTLEGKVDRYYSEYGGDKAVLKWLYLFDDYESFIMKLKIYTADAHEDKLLTDDDIDILETSYNYEEWLYKRKSLKQVFDFYDEEEYEKENREDFDEEEYVFPAREILNGNFPTLDKSKITNEMKDQWRLWDLTDIEYEVFVDIKNDVLIPVYYNIGTSNDKWFGFSIYLKKLYKALNIKANHLTPLITFDRDLLSLDCRDEHHSNEINGKIAAECAKNIVFAVRECARFKSAAGKLEKSEISLGDWTWLWLYAQCINTYREAPRQTGKTFLMTMVFGIEFAIAYEDLMAIVVHFKSSEAIKNRNKMLDSANALPNFLKYHNIKYKTVRGKEKIEMAATDMSGGGSPKSLNVYKNNTLKTVAVGKTESTAEQAGRGDTSQLIGADEINFISQIGVLLTALTFAFSTASTGAKKSGKRYGMHFTSTAGKLNTKHGKEMYKFIYEDMCMFQPELFAYNLNDLEIFLKANSEVNFFVIKYDYDELGYTEEWLDQRIRSAKTVQEIEVEIFQRWVSTDASGLFKLEQVKRLEGMTARMVERNFMYKKNNLIKYFPSKLDMTFEDLIASIHNLMWGIDIASGGGDYSVIYAYDMATLKPVFMYKVNNLVVTDFAIVTIDIIRYCLYINPSMMLVINPEQNGPGLSFIPLLMKERDIEPLLLKHARAYDSRITNETMRPWHRKFSYDTYVEYGSNMTKKTDNGRSLRHVLFEEMLFEIMDKYPYMLAGADLASEIFTLIRKGGKFDGRIEAKSGFHDDVTCAALHCASIILLEENRRMLSMFFNYTVDISKIVNMALDSHIDVFSELDFERDLDNKIEVEVKDMYTYEGAMYQVLTLFKYVNNIRTEIKDKEEKKRLYETDPVVIEAYSKAKKLTVKEYMNADRMQAPKNSMPAFEMPRNDSISNKPVEKVFRPSDLYKTADNRTSSQSYRQNNKFNTKAKMF